MVAGRKKQPGEQRPGWGGKRSGAGRPPANGAGMVKKPVALPADHLAYLRALGDGAVSRGLRVTVERSRGRAIEPAPAGFRRAPSTGELMIKSTVTLWADHLAYLRALGAGVLSEGIRRAVEADRKTPASTP